VAEEAEAIDVVRRVSCETVDVIELD